MAKSRQAFGEATDSKWKNIECGADAAKLIGKGRGRFVAYETTSGYFGWEGNDWHKPGSSTYFGYITAPLTSWDDSAGSSAQGPSMSRILKPEGVDSVCAIIERRIKDGSLRMRKATAKEIADLKEAVASSRAKIEYDGSSGIPLRQALGLGTSTPKRPSRLRGLLQRH